MSKNKWNTMNGIWIKSKVFDMFEDGKSKDEIVNLFYNMNGCFLWGCSTKEQITKAVDELYEIYTKPKKQNIFQKLFCW
jgi:hypothetical protein